MLFQPAIIALLGASAVCLLGMAAAAPFGVQILRHWDIASGSERQLALERRTYLFSTLVSFVLWTQFAVILLFVFNADRMSELFVGAMCAVGTLAADTYGFPALIAQMFVFFAVAGWLSINHADNLAPDYPLVRTKYGLMLGLLPLLAIAFGLQLAYFLGLDANVITSCCGSLFSEGSGHVISELSSLAPMPAMGLTAVAVAYAVFTGLRQAVGKGDGYVTAIAGVMAFAAGILGVISFISLYVYEQPHHHCPFCLLKPEYGYQGYWLYVPLFAATASAVGAGALQRFSRVPTLVDVVPLISRRLGIVAAVGFALFGLVAVLMVLRSNLRLVDFDAAQLILWLTPICCLP